MPQILFVERGCLDRVKQAFPMETLISETNPMRSD